MSAGQRFEAFEGNRQMQAALPADHRVNFIHDDRSRGTQHLAAGLRSQQDVERLRRGHDNMGWPLAHAVTFALWRIAGAYERSDLQIRQAECLQLLTNSRNRGFEEAAKDKGQGKER